MSARIHSDCIAGTSFDTEAAINAPQGIDLIADREFFYRFVRILSCFDVDSLGRTGGGAKITSGALH